ncbi:MAG: hypothetical protein LBI79_06490 [Nitrososphaerota archaeon]|jgi:transposase|nr:hypothetical protein [Nitrososphaerota archaeon]
MAHAPKRIPNYKTVNSFYTRATKNGLWEEMTALLVQKTRLNAKRNADPSYCLIDSQSVKTTSASEERGFDGGKKSRPQTTPHTDVMGNLLKVVVGAANIHDTIAGCDVFVSVLEKYPSLLGVCGNEGYRGTFLRLVESLPKYHTSSPKIVLKGWSVLPKRWCVDRTFGWLLG